MAHRSCTCRGWNWHTQVRGVSSAPCQSDCAYKQMVRRHRMVLSLRSSSDLGGEVRLDPVEQAMVDLMQAPRRAEHAHDLGALDDCKHMLYTLLQRGFTCYHLTDISMRALRLSPVIP